MAQAARTEEETAGSDATRYGFVFKLDEKLAAQDIEGFVLTGMGVGGAPAPGATIAMEPTFPSIVFIRRLFATCLLQTADGLPFAIRSEQSSRTCCATAALLWMNSCRTSSAR